MIDWTEWEEKTMKVSTGTISRTVVLVIALVNQILTMFGWNPLPFSDDEVYVGITTVFTVAAALVNWWKNNSFSRAAIIADDYMKNLQESQKNTDQE